MRQATLILTQVCLLIPVKLAFATSDPFQITLQHIHPPLHPQPPFPEVVCEDPPVVCQGGKYRTADGSCNNLHGHIAWGQAGRPQKRLLRPAYQNGRDSPRTLGVRGYPLPSAREVSQAVHKGDNQRMVSPDLTHLFTTWGQFLDHDITLTPRAKDLNGSALECCIRTPILPERTLNWLSSDGINWYFFSYDNINRAQTHVNRNPNCLPIHLSPETDRHFRTNCMNFVRSKSFAPSATCRSATREQGNKQTSFIDGSQVYGASLGDQFHLRTGLMGQLKIAVHNMLPENRTTKCTKNLHEGEYCFGSGDPRVNESPMLSGIHLMFHRLHNMLASHLSLINRHWDDETLYQEARKIVGAILQHVTYAEYLPLLLGDREMARYNLTLHGAIPYTYDRHVNPDIFNSFSTAAFRFGHSMINGKNSWGLQKVNIREMFFHPHFIQYGEGVGLTMVLNGLIRDHSQSADRFINRDLTDHLFESLDGRSFDLASLNIQRGRDHGLPPYHHFRQLCGLPWLQEVTRLGKFADPFLNVYRDLEDIDLFTGGLIEGLVEGGAVGPTFACLIGRQFHRIRFGDRFWYQNTRHEGAFTPDQIQTIERLSLADVMCYTTSMSAVQVNSFVRASLGNPMQVCSSLPPIDLRAWQI